MAASRLTVIIGLKPQAADIDAKARRLVVAEPQAPSVPRRGGRRAGTSKARTAAVIPNFGQVALVRLPIVQNTTARERLLGGEDIRAATASALKVKTRAMPRRTMVSTVTPRMVDAKWMKSAATIAIRKASTGTINCDCYRNIRDPAPGRVLRRSPAAADIPSVNGLASGLCEDRLHLRACNRQARLRRSPPSGRSACEYPR